MTIEPMEKNALGQNFNVHLFLGEEEFDSIVKSLLPMDLNGDNWGIRHVQGSLAKHNNKFFRHNVVVTFKIISTHHYDQQRRRKQLKDCNTMSHKPWLCGT
jgi:hypothetical protein